MPADKGKRGHGVVKLYDGPLLRQLDTFNQVR
jgi:hypothetical protein